MKLNNRVVRKLILSMALMLGATPAFAGPIGGSSEAFAEAIVEISATDNVDFSVEPIEDAFAFGTNGTLDDSVPGLAIVDGGIDGEAFGLAHNGGASIAGAVANGFGFTTFSASTFSDFWLIYEGVGQIFIDVIYDIEAAIFDSAAGGFAMAGVGVTSTDFGFSDEVLLEFLGGTDFGGSQSGTLSMIIDVNGAGAGLLLVETFASAQAVAVQGSVPAASVPEPSTILLLLSGLAALAYRRRLAA